MMLSPVEIIQTILATVFAFILLKFTFTISKILRNTDYEKKV